MTPQHTVAAVLELEKEQLQGWSKTSWNYRTLQAIRRCRTSEMGYHIDKCDCCEALHMSYNSCRNRHCPSCQGHKREQWIQAREKDLLPVSYFHVVFTIPSELNEVALSHPKEVYDILFQAAWETLKQFGENPKHLGAKVGMISILHTWGQSMQLHPHLHCIVPGGGVDENGQWKRAKNKGKYLFNVEAMSVVFRAKFVSKLRKKLPHLIQDLYNKLFKKEWVVYAKSAFQAPKHVIEYLGRYTHKIAISNYRILAIDKEKRTVTFSLKDYRNNGKKTTMKLSTEDFIQRFSLHILPKGFTRIRHYGILSGTWKSKNLEGLKEQFSDYKQEKESKEKEPKTLLKTCPICKKGKLITILTVERNRPPPVRFRELIKNHNFMNTN